MRDRARVHTIRALGCAVLGAGVPVTTLHVEPSAPLVVAVSAYGVHGARTLRLAVQRDVESRAGASPCPRVARLEVVGPRGGTLALREFPGGACALTESEATLVVAPFTDTELQDVCAERRAPRGGSTTRSAVITTRLLDARGRVLWQQPTTVRATITCPASASPSPGRA